MVDREKGGTEITCKSSSSNSHAETIGPSGKRKASRSDSFGGSPVQITRKGKNLDEQCKKLGFSSDDGIKKIRSSSVRSESNSVQLRKVKSDSAKALNDNKRELRKMNSEPRKNLDGNLQLVTVPRKVSDEEMKKFEDKNVVDESNKDIAEESPVGIMKSRSDEDCKELKAIAYNVAIDQIQTITAPPDVDYIDSEEEDEKEEEVDKEIEVYVEKKNLDIVNSNVEEQKPKKLVIKEHKLFPSNERSAPIMKKQAKIHQSPTKTKPIPVSDNFDATPSKLQSLGDLIMWRDASRSAFVFGIGAFAIISSSYTKDLNISFISVLSYIGLVYLGVSFIFRSFISRGSIDMDKINQEYVVGEEEVVWLVKLILPYVNEFLLKLRSLFSGDPVTTLKLAVVLFILARCGGSITIWKMSKLGFFGVFVVPKLWSSYSPQLAAYGTFWIRRFGDAWESCSHKKAVGFGIFTLVWNLSSIVARIWTVFILLVGFKYYQHLKAANSISEYTQPAPTSTDKHKELVS